MKLKRNLGKNNSKLLNHCISQFPARNGTKRSGFVHFFVVFNCTICSISHGAVEVSLLQLVLVNHRTSHDWILKRCAVSPGKAHTIELFFPRGVGGLYTGIQTVNANVFGLQDESLSHFCKGSFIPRKKSSPLWKVPFNLYLPGKHRNPCHYFRQQSTGF